MEHLLNLKIQFPFQDPPSFNKKFQLSNLIYDKYITKYIKLEESRKNLKKKMQNHPVSQRIIWR